MRSFYQVAVLILSVASTTMAQSSTSYLTEPGANRKYNGLSHIELDLGQRNTLLIGFDRYEQIKARQNIDSVLRLFITDYGRIEDTTQTPTRAVHALFRLGETDRAIDLRYTSQLTTSFLFRDEQAPVQVKTRQDTLQVVWSSALVRSVPQDFSIYLFVNSISDVSRLLSQGGVNAKLQAALESVRQYKGHDLTDPRMSFDMIQQADKTTKFIGPGLAKSPFISFQPGIGIGFIKTEVVASLNFDIQFTPSRFRKVGYTIGYTSNFLLRRDKIDFINVGMAFYRRDKNSRNVSFNQPVATFYIGFLVLDSRDLLPRNAIRLGGTVYQRGLFKVQPEVYIGSFIKQVYPGLRLVVGL